MDALVKGLKRKRRKKKMNVFSVYCKAVHKEKGSPKVRYLWWNDYEGKGEYGKTRPFSVLFAAFLKKKDARGEWMGWTSGAYIIIQLTGKWKKTGFYKDGREKGRHRVSREENVKTFICKLTGKYTAP